jgi:hypothetical protein
VGAHVAHKEVKARAWRGGMGTSKELELGLELIQTHVTQRPLLWVEAGASTGVARGALLYVSGHVVPFNEAPRAV